MTLFYVQIPGCFPAYSFRAASEREARRAFCVWAGLSRCPKGTGVWEG